MPKATHAIGEPDAFLPDSTSDVNDVPRLSRFHDYSDRYVDKNIEWVDPYLEELTELAFDYLGVTSAFELINRKRTTSIDFDNPATRKLCEDNPGVRNWLSTIPTALSLELLTNQDDPPIGTTWSEPTKVLGRNCADGIGVRARESVAGDVLQDEISRVANTNRSPKILSLACGAARAVIQVASRHRQNGIVTDLSLVDTDWQSLGRARELARKEGQQIQVFRRNIVDLEGFQRYHTLNQSSVALMISDLKTLHLPNYGHLPNLDVITPGSYDIVDVLGFFEYLKNVETFPFHYDKVFGNRGELMQAGAPRFLSMAWEMVQPGGVLLIGNMNRSNSRTGQPRKQLGVTLGVIQWPHIQPRDEPEVLDILQSATTLELVDRRTIQSITVHKTITCDTEDDIYNIYEFRKSE